VGTEVIHVSEPLAAMEVEVTQPDTARRGPTAAVFPAMDMETMQMFIAPGKQDLQKRMEVCQSGIAVHQHPTPDEWADATQDDTQLVDAERCSSNSHGLRVAQSLVPLKGVPRYLVLSKLGGARRRDGVVARELQVVRPPGAERECR
jgi:hypothetical protein